MFTLVMDKTRSHLLQMMMNQCAGSQNFLETLVAKDEKNDGDYVKELEAFVQEFAEKVHEADFCIDPECQYGK